MRTVRWAVAVLGIALATGCAGPRPRGERPLGKLAAAIPADLARCRAYARQLAARASSEAHRLTTAREKGEAKEIERAMASLADNDAAVEALDEAVRHLELAASYVQQRPWVRLAPAELQRLDADVRTLRTTALALADHALQLVQARNADDADAVEATRTEIERDRAVLEALRTDLLITARFGRTDAEARRE
ncbi:MAG: hypothetical protein D6776_09580 [Planctomycetota bacterium]|nr:MAG: hypothetical protein D6776_09580 [Planctomycetota bacterium]